MILVAVRVRPRRRSSKPVAFSDFPDRLGARLPLLLHQPKQGRIAMSIKRLSSVVIGALLVASATGVPAAPNVYWHHVHTVLSQADCLSKAEAVMLGDKTGRIVKDNDSVRSWSEKTAGIVECLKIDTGVFVMILVASDDAQEASILQNKLEKALTSK
jgi:hypothetical protein